MPGDEVLVGAKLAADVGKVVAKKSVKSKINNAITNCFTAGTKIQTAEGAKNIEDIQVGDKVLAKDEKTGKQEYKEVVQLQVDTIYQVHVGKEVIETIAEHPFWVAEKGWVQAKDLQPGDKLETDQGQHVKVTQIVKQEKQKTVYNFEVKDYHTYYVSGLHLLVHNKCIPWSSNSVKKAANDLTKGAKEITVGNRSEAEELFLRLYQFGRVVGHGTNNEHGGLPHLQIHTKKSGDVIRIFYRP